MGLSHRAPGSRREIGGKMMVGPVFLEAKQAVRELASTQDAHLGYYTTVEVLWCKKSEKR